MRLLLIHRGEAERCVTSPLQYSRWRVGGTDVQDHKALVGLDDTPAVRMSRTSIDSNVDAVLELSHRYCSGEWLYLRYLGSRLVNIFLSWTLTVISGIHHIPCCPCSSILKNVV